MNILKRSLKCTLVCFLFLGSTLFVQMQDVPPGVRYKSASAETNADAKRLIETTLKTSSDKLDADIFESAVMVGPLLWDSLNDAQKSKFKGATQVALIVGSTNKQGRGVRDNEQKKFLWSVVADKVSKQTFAVRQADTKEIAYYWATIPFDIEEPLLVIDAGETKILVNFTSKNNKLRIFWIDIVGDAHDFK